VKAWKIRCAAFVRALSATVFCALRAGPKLRRAIGAAALACATLFLLLSAAQAQTDTTTSLSSTPAGCDRRGLRWQSAIADARRHRLYLLFQRRSAGAITSRFRSGFLAPLFGCAGWQLVVT
jgi:hypothetical protein